MPKDSVLFSFIHETASRRFTSSYRSSKRVRPVPFSQPFVMREHHAFFSRSPSDRLGKQPLRPPVCLIDFE